MTQKTRFRRLLNRIGYDVAAIPVGRPGRDLIEDIRRLSNGNLRTVFDVGANVGKNALEYCAEYRDVKVFCFEPFSDTYEELCRNVAGYPNIVSLNLALGAENCDAIFHLHSGSDQNSILEDSPESHSFVGAEFFKPKGISTIEVKTLDSVCVEHSIDLIDFIKIDTQGYELQVLHGAKSTFSAERVRLLLLEVNFIPLYKSQPSFAELTSFLEPFNFSLVGFYNQTYFKNRYLMWADALFVQRNVIEQ